MGVSPSFGWCQLLGLAVSQLRERWGGQSPWQPQAYHFMTLCPATAKSYPKSGTDAGHQIVWWWWKTELSIKLAYCSVTHQCTSWRIYPHCLWHYSANIMVGGKPTNLGLWARRWTRRLWWITPLILTANRCILNLLFLREYSIIYKYVDKVLFWSMTPFSQHSSSSWKLNVILGVIKTPLGNWRRSWLPSCSQKL